MDFEARQRIRRASAFDWRKSGRNADEYPKSVGTGISFRAIYNACSTTCLRHAEDSHVSVIETNDLRKRYRRIQALKGVSLKVEKGEIYGLLGQNGAGKSTLVKILLNIVRRSEGEAFLLGEPIGNTHARKRVGYLPEDHRFPEYHSAHSLLVFYSGLYGLSHNDQNKRIPEMLELVGLKGRMHSKIRTYSKGMKQRLGLAQAMFHNPEVIILDEPTDGVDPVGRKEIRAIMQQLKSEGKTIFLNSHLLGEVELICDRVAILQRGEMIREGDIATLTKQKGHFQIGLKDGQDLPESELASKGYMVRKDGLYWEVGVQDGQTIDPVIDLLRDRGLKLRHLVEKRQSLEDLFMQTVESAEPGIDAPALRRDRPERAQDRRAER
jgi:ABC-2 type transport system ATP-binding protein